MQAGRGPAPAMRSACVLEALLLHEIRPNGEGEQNLTCVIGREDEDLCETERTLKAIHGQHRVRDEEKRRAARGVQ